MNLCKTRLPRTPKPERRVRAASSRAVSQSQYGISRTLTTYRRMTIQFLAILCVSMQVASALLAWNGHTRPAAVLTSLLGFGLTAIALVISLPVLIERFSDREALARQYAANRDIPISLAIAATAAVVVGLSLLAAFRPGRVIWIAWSFALPLVAFMVYLAFFFKIF
jgi:hypothetical protein